MAQTQWRYISINRIEPGDAVSTSSRLAAAKPVNTQGKAKSLLKVLGSLSCCR
jgi:hypothetical protein